MILAILTLIWVQLALGSNDVEKLLRKSNQVKNGLVTQTQCVAMCLRQPEIDCNVVYFTTAKKCHLLTLKQEDVEDNNDERLLEVKRGYEIDGKHKTLAKATIAGAPDSTTTATTATATTATTTTTTTKRKCQASLFYNRGGTCPYVMQVVHVTLELKRFGYILRTRPLTQ